MFSDYYICRYSKNTFYQIAFQIFKNLVLADLLSIGKKIT